MTPAIRHDWTHDEVAALFALPFNDLLLQAQTIHRTEFEPNTVQLSTLLSIKTGACPEDCKYCPQSVRYDTGLEREALLPVTAVRHAARKAKAAGATRFCMGAAWRSPKDRDLDAVCDMIDAVRAEGMETCMTLGMLTPAQSQRLAERGLDYYNHNLDSSPEYYKQVISTRTYQDRLDTLDNVRAAGMKTCCGGIVGMGEQPQDRVELLRTLATLPEHPDSVPINNLVQVAGTPLADLGDGDGVEPIDPLDFVRTIAVARILMPKAHVRLSAGRQSMSDELQALCFMAGANSIFYGDQLLTTENPVSEADKALFERLGLKAEARQAAEPDAAPCRGEAVAA